MGGDLRDGVRMTPKF